MTSMTWTEQGSAASPVDTHDSTPPHVETGISLRDWFAGQAISGIIEVMRKKNDLKYEDVAYGCYKIADAMLEAGRRPE